MKKRIYVCCFLFTVSIFHLLIPDVVVGQVTAKRVSENHVSLFERNDIRTLLPEVLMVFTNPQNQIGFNSAVIGHFLTNPLFLQQYDPDVNPQFLSLLTIDTELRALFGDADFHEVLQNPTEINELVKLIPPPGNDDNDDDNTNCDPPASPKATTLSIVSGYGQEGPPGTRLPSPFVVVVRNQYGDAFSGANVAFRVTRGDGGLSQTMPRTNSLGQASTYLTLGSIAGANWVEASVTNIEESQFFTALATVSTKHSEPKPTRLLRVSGNDQVGDINTRLNAPFIVRVRDQDNNPLAGIGVTFRVTMGGGQLSDATAITDSSGRAAATLTLGSLARVNRVLASVVGISQGLSFSATAVLPAVPLPPSVYWIEDGKLYHRPTDGEEIEMLRESPSGWTLTGGLTVDMVGEKVYWTEGKGNRGRIWHANLDGTDGEGLIRLEVGDGVPYGVAVGTDSREKRWVYWTTSVGKIQRIGIGGSGSKSKQDVVESLHFPKHIAFDEKQHKLYWTEKDRLTGADIIRRANANGKSKVPVVEGLGDLGGIAVADGVVYWTERTSNGQGRVRSINGTGSGLKLLAVLESESIPEGIAVDSVGGRAYWTTSRGGIDSAPLIGVIQTEVEGAGIRTTGIALGRSSSGASGVAGAPSINSMESVESALLANYPNPFNPETWIPYQLSESANVTVSIYSVNGSLIRTLVLGHQAAGTYRSRSRAAYWDGRNDFGERVASGLYFYTLTAGDFTATRKMLIRK